MADINYTITKLEEQIKKVDQGDLGVWLNETYSYIEDYFNSYSPRAMAFKSLISDYEYKKIGDDFSIKRLDYSYFRKKGLEYIKGYIQYLNEQKELKLKEDKKENTDPVVKQIKSFDEFYETKHPKQEGGQNSQVPPIKTQLPFGIKPELFWTVFASIVTVAFLLGLYFGQSKFDKEKSDFYEENKLLKTRIQKKTTEIEKLKKQIQSITTNYDSLNVEK